MPLLDRLRHIDTASLSDADKALRVLPSAIRRLAAGQRMVGRVVTAEANGDLMSVLAALHICGAGDVLVVSAGTADLAVAGELFCTEAARRGMTGVVIDGLCRDSALLVRLGLPVYSRGTTPRAPGANAVPVMQVPVRIGEVEVRPGDVVLGDDDGIVVGSEAEFEAAVDAAEAIQTREKALRSAIEQGQSLFDSLNFGEHAERLRAGVESALTFDA
jgi:regulator of RNase E activity RraA